MRLVKKPVLCNYYVTYRCNASCSFCDIWERPSPYINLENVRDNLRDLKRLGVKVIDFTGGEPLLHREIDKILSLAKEFGFITTVTTNTLLYPKWAEKIKGNVDMLHFSLDAATKEKHDASRGVACFDFLMESIDVAKKLGERPDILFTVTEESIGDIEKVYKSIVLPNHLVLILNPIFDYKGIEGQSSFSRESFQIMRYWARQKNVYLNEAFLALREEGGNQIESPVCKAASSTVVISPENKLVLPCYHLGLKEVPIENNLYDLYQSEDVKKMVGLEGRLPECEGCVINCYMQPSFSVNINRFWFKALPGTLKYNIMKGTWKQLLK